MLHLDDRGDPLSSAQPQDGHIGGCWDRIPVEGDHAEKVAWQRQTAYLAGTRVEYVKENALATFHPHRLAGAQPPAVDAKGLVFNLEAFLSERTPILLVGLFADLL